MAARRAGLVYLTEDLREKGLLLGKTMLAEPDIVIIDEPARGIDIGTKQQLYAFIASLAAARKSVIFVSSGLPEVIVVGYAALPGSRWHKCRQEVAPTITRAQRCWLHYVPLCAS